MLTQASDPSYRNYVEHTMWMESKVVISTLSPSDPLYARHPLGGLSAPNFTRVVVQGSADPPLSICGSPSIPKARSCSAG